MIPYQQQENELLAKAVTACVPNESRRRLIGEHRRRTDMTKADQACLLDSLRERACIALSVMESAQVIKNSYAR